MSTKKQLPLNFGKVANPVIDMNAIFPLMKDLEDKIGTEWLQIKFYADGSGEIFYDAGLADGVGKKIVHVFDDPKKIIPVLVEAIDDDSNQ